MLRSDVDGKLGGDLSSPGPIQDLPSLAFLTPRQIEIVHLVAAGFTNAEIASQLVVARGTVANHIAQILRRLGMHSRVQIATWAAARVRRPGQTSTLATPRPSVSRRVLIVEDDETICELVRGVLAEEGYVVSTLTASGPAAVRVAINKLEPDCVLLDSTTRGDYGASWDTAAWARTRGRPVPIVMFTAHAADSREAASGRTHRSRLASFAAVIAKPFDMDMLVSTVAGVVGSVAPCDRSAKAEAGRSGRLRIKLEAAGASGIEIAQRREWATFRCPDGTLAQLYWWEPNAMYHVLRYSHGPPDFIGRVKDLGTAIDLAVLPSAGARTGGR